MVNICQIRGFNCLGHLHSTVDRRYAYATVENFASIRKHLLSFSRAAKFPEPTFPIQQRFFEFFDFIPIPVHVEIQGVARKQIDRLGASKLLELEFVGLSIECFSIPVIAPAAN